MSEWSEEYDDCYPEKDLAETIVWCLEQRASGRIPGVVLVRVPRDPAKDAALERFGDALKAVCERWLSGEFDSDEEVAK